MSVSVESDVVTHSRRQQSTCRDDQSTFSTDFSTYFSFRAKSKLTYDSIPFLGTTLSLVLTIGIAGPSVVPFLPGPGFNTLPDLEECLGLVSNSGSPNFR